jgi:hypothetical protein
MSAVARSNPVVITRSDDTLNVNVDICMHYLSQNPNGLTEKLLCEISPGCQNLPGARTTVNVTADENALHLYVGVDLTPIYDQYGRYQTVRGALETSSTVIENAVHEEVRRINKVTDASIAVIWARRARQLAQKALLAFQLAQKLFLNGVGNADDQAMVTFEDQASMARLFEEAGRYNPFFDETYDCAQEEEWI